MSTYGSGYFDQEGTFHRANDKAMAAVPEEFSTALTDLKTVLDLAMNYLGVFGGLPVPVAEDILCRIEPVQAAIDMAVHGACSTKERVN